MRTIRLSARLAAGCLVAWGSMSAARAANPPTPQAMLGYRPVQKDAVQISTPTEAELPSCKVEVVNGPGTFSGYILRDGRGQVLRKFGATKGPSAKVDFFAYYLDGQEVYREFDGASGREYRWFGAGGMRWGVDVNGDGQIDGWRQISAEEVSQEVLRAVITKNFNRLKVLTISEQEMKSLDTSAQELTRIRESVNKLQSKYQETVGKLGQLNDTTRWLHLETPPPQCTPAEALGGKKDLIGYHSATIVYETGNKAEFLQTGELIQVGLAWRLVGGPAPGHDMEAIVKTPGQINLTDDIKPLIDELGQLDKNAPQPGDTGAIVRYNLQRAGVLEKIAGKMTKPDDAEQWVRQIADCYSTASQASGPKDTTAYKRLVTLKNQIAKAQPGSPLAGYVAYREMSAEYANKLNDPSNNQADGGVAKIQEGWRDRLNQFVKEYPTAEDTPDALLQLGMISEFVNKETEAKNYYGVLVQNYGQSQLAAKAQGALRRLNADGKDFEMSGPALGNGQPINVAQLRGKVVVVYYWATWTQQAAADFFKLKSLLAANSSKVDLVCINLDATAAEAQNFIAQSQAPGHHLYQTGGLESPLAVQYGVMVLPNLFLVGKDGKVVSHTVQMSTLDDEVKKLLEK
jgi:hypothetical protein